VRGNRTKVISDALGCIIESQYDDADNLLKMLVKNLDGKVNETFLYEYDSSNRLTREEYQHGTASDVKTYEYDETGRTSSIVSEYNGVVTCRETYEYDENGNLKKQLNDYNTTATVTTRSYDEHGNVIEERKEENGKCLDRVCYEYDANGNCVKKTVEHPTANRSAETVYEYDKWGNLIGCETEEFADGISWTHSYVYQNYKLYYDPQSA
jgi:antitoxin component YwqK of YwqJK toxin-antitoxin module